MINSVQGRTHNTKGEEGHRSFFLINSQKCQPECRNTHNTKGDEGHRSFFLINSQKCQPECRNTQVPFTKSQLYRFALRSIVFPLLYILYCISCIVHIDLET